MFGWAIQQRKRANVSRCSPARISLYALHTRKTIWSICNAIWSGCLNLQPFDKPHKIFYSFCT